MSAASASPQKDFFISYTQTDEPWAEWFAWKLEQAGYSVTLRAWDFQPGDNFVVKMHEAVSSCARTLAVLSPAYLRDSRFAQAQWAAAFATDPTSKRGTLLPVLVEPCDPSGMLGPIVSCDLMGQNEETATRLLLAAAARESLRPAQSPPFPGRRPVLYPGAPTLPSGREGGAGPASVEREPLPGPPRPFFGREDVLEEIVTSLLSDEVRAIPLLGTGGIGKSTVSRAALHEPRVVQRFGERRYFVPSETCQTAEALVATTARAMGIQSNEPALLSKQFLAELGRERTLLVLDNLETPWWGDETGTERFLEQLGGLPSLTLMASIRGESWPRHPDWREPISLKPLAKEDAKQVFMATARKERLARDPLLDDLLEQIERVPLAIALLAHVSKTEPDLRGIWKSWEKQRTALLKRGSGATRLESVEFSYELSIGSRKMTPQARRLLSVLALLPAGIEREHLDVLPRDMEPFDAARTLRELGLAHDEGARLRMLAPLREYVCRHHPAGGSDLDVLIEHYIGLATQLGVRVGEEGGEEASRRLADEVANLDSMIQRGLNRNAPELAIGAATALANFMQHSGLGSPRMLAMAREAARRVMNILGEANCLKSLGDMLLQRSEHQEARTHYEEALPLYRRVGNVLGEAYCIQRLGDIAQRRFEHPEARKRYEEALPLFHRVGNVFGEATCIQSLGDLALERSEYQEARQRFEQALPLCRRVGHVLCEANCIKCLGDIALRHSEHQEAQQRYEEALPLYRRVGSVLGEANCIQSLGDIALRRSEHQEAQRRYEEALPLYRRVGSVVGEANCIQSLGDIALERSQYEKAQKRNEEALPLYRRIGNIHGEANCIHIMGTIAWRLSDPQQARKRYEEALNLYARIPEPFSMGWTHYRMAQIAENSDERLQHIRAAREAWTRIGRDDLLQLLTEEFGEPEQDPS